MFRYPHSSTKGNDFSSSDKFTQLNRRNGGCPICQSQSGKCKSKGDLVFCMSDVEADLSIWLPLGETKNKDWQMYLPRAKAGSRQAKSVNRAKTSKHVKSSASALSPNVINSIYCQIAKEIGLSDRAKADLIRRGLNPETYLGFSTSKGNLTAKALNTYGTDGAKLFPGADDRGHLYFSGEGYTVPAFDTYGRVIGYQVRYFDLDNRYSWASTNNKVEIEGELELPLTQLSPSDSKVLYLTEGLLKPFVASTKLGINVLGGAGGNLASSPKQLALALEGYEQVIWAVDAGAINNNKVIRQYLRAAKVIKQLTDIDTQYLWYGQTNKETGKDIDEIIDIETFNSAQVISLTELLESAESYGIDTNALVEYWESDDTASEKDIHVDINDDTESESEAEAGTSKKTLVITENFDVYQQPKQANRDVIYFPSLYVAEMNQTLWEIDLFKYQEIELVTKQGDKYSPWLDSGDEDMNACSVLRYLHSYLTRLTGAAPIGDTKYDKDLKAYLGLIEDNDDPYYADREQLVQKGTKIYRGKDGKTVPEKTLPKLKVRTSIGTVPLGAVAYFGSSLPLPNADRSTVGKYLPKLDLLEDETQYQGKIVGIRADKGSGKTRNIKSVVDQLSAIYGGCELGVTAINPTIMLSRQLAEKIGGDCLALPDFSGVGLSPNELASITRTPRISLCMNSMVHLATREYGEGHVLILEEVETILASFLDPHSHYDKSQISKIREELARGIHETIEKLGIVLVLDADLKDITLIKLAEFARVDPSKIVRINHKREDEGYKYTFAKTWKEIAGEIFESVRKGERIIIACDSKDKLKQFNEEFLALGIDDIMFLHRETIGHPDYVAFTENPDKFLETHKPRVFGYNSVMGTGFDINYDQFDKMFELAFGVLTPDQVRQKIIRYRSVSIPRYIWASERAMGSPAAISYKPNEIRQELRDDVADTINAVGLTYTAYIQASQSKADPLLDLRALQVAKRNYQQNGYRHAIEGGLLIAENCTYFEHDFTLEGSLKQAKETIEHREAQLIEEVDVVTDIKAFKVLDAKAYKTETELARWIKTITANKLPGVEIDYKFAREYVVSSSGNKKLRGLQRLGNVLFNDISTAITRNYVETRVNAMLSGEKDHHLFTEFKNNAQQNKTLFNLGMPGVMEEVLKLVFDNAVIDEETQLAQLPEKVTVDLKAPAIDHCLTKYTKNFSVYNKAMKIRARHGLKKPEKFKKLLGQVGIKVSINHGVATVHIPHDFLDILTAHYTVLKERYDKLYNDGNIPKESYREKPDISPLEALAGKVSELNVTDLEVIKEVVLNLVGSNNTSNRPRGGATCVGAGNKSPNPPPS